MAAIGSTITLSKADQLLVREAAERRQSTNVRVGARNLRAGGMSDLRTHLEGLGGEVAFCRLFGLPIPTLVKRRPEAAPDVVLDGYRVDVKSTRYKTGKLVVSRSASSHLVTDFYALMVGAFPTYTFRGFASAAETLTESRIDYHLPTPAYAVPQADLTETMFSQLRLTI